MKKIFSVLLALVLSLGLVPAVVSANGITFPGLAIAVDSLHLCDLGSETLDAFNAEPENYYLLGDFVDAQTCSQVVIEGEVSDLSLGAGWVDTAYVEIGLRPEATMNERNAGVFLIALNGAGDTQVHLQDYTGGGRSGGVINIPKNSPFRYKITLEPSVDIGGTATLEVWVGEDSQGTATLPYGYASTWEENVAGAFDEDFSKARLFFSIIADRRGVAGENYTATLGAITMDDTLYVGAGQQFTTIQEAINFANPGDTINVVSGIYVEDPTINESLTLSGPNAAISPNTGTRVDEAIIDGTISVSGAIDSVTIQGFHFEVTPGVASINCPGGFDGDDLHILRNSFTADPATDVAWEAIGVHSNFAVAGLVIDDNLVTGVRGIFVNPGTLELALSEVTITNNVIDGDPTTPAFAGISVDAVSGIVSGNEISNTADAGINVGSGILACDGLTISNNTVTNAGCGEWSNAGAINLYSDCTYIIITGNTLAGSWQGISIKGGMGPLGVPIIVNYNNITGNRNRGIFNDADSGDLHAENNWWDNASGPSGDSSVLGYDVGYGDQVSDDVRFEPWLLAEVVEGVPTTTYTKTLALKKGWTLVSTDNRITVGDSDWVGKIMAYTYTVSEKYVEATLADLRPVDALYVKTAADGGVGITYSGVVPVASSKDLEMGWNLISSATATPADDVLSPLRYVEVGEQQGVGLATLASQGDYNQFSGSLYLATLTELHWDDLAGETLSPFDGYWIYMNAAKSFGVIPD